MQDAMERAGTNPTAVVISGEAGIGKSRLIDEFSVPLPSGSVAYGACMELAGEPIVFAAVKDALRHVEDRDLELRSDRASSSESLNRIEQFDQWARLLEEPDGQLPPRVLVVEDLHWADDSTLSFLSYLLRSLRRYRLMVVLTRRDDEIARAATSDAVLAELLRLPYVTSLQLSRLTEDEAAELMHGTDAGTAGRFYELSEGNPYLLGELVAAGGQMPGHIRDILVERVRRLSPDAQSLARVAAVAGLAIDDEILWRASPLDETRHLEALHDIVDGGLLRTEGGRYVFRHSLTREALLEGLLPFEVRRLNAAVATALEKESGPRRGGPVREDRRPLARRGRPRSHLRSQPGGGPSGLFGLCLPGILASLPPRPRPPRPDRSGRRPGDAAGRGSGRRPMGGGPLGCSEPAAPGAYPRLRRWRTRRPA